MELSVENANPNASIATEFVVSVTGHRDLVAHEEAATRDAVRTVLEGLQSRLLHMSLRLVTGLAEGADTIAAEVALELGITVSAVLPMPTEFYSDDFDGDARILFDKLLLDERVNVLEIPLANGSSPEDMSSQDARDIQYGLLRNYIIRRSNVLLALWDGETTGLAGGTADVVLGYLSGATSEMAPTHVNDEIGAISDCADLVIWVPVQRQSHTDVKLSKEIRYLVSNSNGDCFWEQAAIPEKITGRWRDLDKYASDYKSDLGRDLEAWGLGADEHLASIDSRPLENDFIRADQLARANQGNSDLLFKVFGLIAAAMGFFFLVYAKLLAIKALLVVYIALFAVGYFAFKFSAKRHWLGHHLAYRALAETLRVQYFLILSGAGENYNIRKILNLSSVDQFDRFEWLQDAVRCGEPLVYFGHGDAENSIELTRELWVKDQASYFRKKIHTMHKKHKRLEVVKASLLAGSILGALALIFFKKSLIHMEMAGFDGKAWLVFLMGLLPFWVAVWELYQGKMATRELLWQYTNQERYFTAATGQIKSAENVIAARKIITDLADKALIEIYLWSVHRYHREHEPPAAG